MHSVSMTTALLALLVTAPLAAQGVASDTTSNAATVIAAPPSLDFTQRWQPASTAALLPWSVATATVTPPLFTPRQPTSRSTAMIVVGGAAMLVGAVVKGDGGNIIMVGGGVLALYGLWQHLK
jgi:hypothetical protein